MFYKLSWPTNQLAEGRTRVIHKSSVTERDGALMSLAPRHWLNIPKSLACSRRGGLKAALVRL